MEALPPGRQGAGMDRDGELEAAGDAPRALDEVGCGVGRAGFRRGRLEQLQPAVEMRGIDRKR